jgi:luciferase family oxidoreductase group 1
MNGKTFLPLSVLDLVPLTTHGADGDTSASGRALRNSLELAQAADRLGYTRYWFAEHHNMPTVASTTPEILIALAAERTERIHVGSGGVMLPNHSPLKVAETFKMLEALYPGRIDLGLGRAPGTDPATARILRGARGAGGDRFLAMLADLLEFGGLTKPAEEPRERSAFGETFPLTVRPHVVAVPEGTPLPPIWLLGSSDFSAHLAAQLGMGFGFAAHFSDFEPKGPMLAYRREFTPGGHLARPHAILTLSVIAAPTDAEAERLASSLVVAFTRLRTGQPSILLPPDEALAYEFSPVEQSVADSLRDRHIVGAPETVVPRIRELAARTEADEVMVTTFTYGHAERVRSYELLAEAFGLAHAV